MALGEYIQQSLLEMVTQKVYTWRHSDLTFSCVLRGVPKLVISFWESPLFQPACDGIIPTKKFINNR